MRTQHPAGDAFEQLLEDSLAGPDLELGHERRLRLLQAASRPQAPVAVAEEPPEPGKVVPFERPETLEAFDWLVGEHPATPAMIGRLIASTAALSGLESERRFIGELRHATRRTHSRHPHPHPAAAPGGSIADPQRGRGTPVTAWTAVAAAILLIFAVAPVIAMRNGSGGGSSGGTAAEDGSAGRDRGSLRPVVPGFVVSPAPAASRAVAAMDLLPSEDAGIRREAPGPPHSPGETPDPMAGNPAGTGQDSSRTRLAALAASGCSIPAEGLDGLAAGTLESLAGDQPPLLAMLDLSRNPSLFQGSWMGASLASSFQDLRGNGYGNDSGCMNPGGGGNGGDDGEGDGGGGETITVPEPGIATLAGLATLVLLNRRRRALPGPGAS